MFDLGVINWMVIPIALLCIVIILLMKYRVRHDDYWEKRGVPYAPRRNLFSAIKQLGEKPFHEFLMERARKYGKLFGMLEAGTPTLCVADPELLRDILVKDFHIFPNRRVFSVGDLTDKMVVMLKGEDWKRVRTIITPAFTSKRMRQMSSIINNCSKSLDGVLQKHAEKGEPIDVRGLFAAFTMDVIASAAFGTKIDSYSDPKNEFVEQAKKNFVELSTWRIIFFSFFPLSFLKYLKMPIFSSIDFFSSLTKAVIKKRLASGERHNDVLQILMDAADEELSSENADLNVDEEDRYGSIINKETTPQQRYKTISQKELLAQCILFFFVGYETSASILTFIAYCLASNPEWQEKVIQEVDEAFVKSSDMNYDSVKDMKILDAVVSETLRLYPPLIQTDRTAVEDYKLGNTGITIQKGMIVSIPVYAIHHDPDHFEDPEKFNPNRFLESIQPKHHPYAYLPFGAGPRNCLGMRFALLEIKLCVANILRHYRLGLHETTKIPLEFRKRFQFISVNELPLAVTKRSDHPTQFYL